MRLHPAVACAVVVIGGLLIWDPQFVSDSRSHSSPPMAQGLEVTLKRIGGVSLILIGVLFSFTGPPPKAADGQ